MRVPIRDPTRCLVKRQWYGFVIAALTLGLTVTTGQAAPRSPESLRDAQAAFEAKQYPKALSLLDPLTVGDRVSVEARRLKLRTLIKLGKPRDAALEYELIEQGLGKDDVPLLRELCLGAIVPLLTDMREQMRGAGYTALKESESEDTVRYFEDGLTDGSGLIRALAAEGLGKLKAGRQSARLRKALDDQAAVVRATALKALGRSGEPSVLALAEKAVSDEQPMVHVAALGVQAMLGRREAIKKLEASVASLNPEEKGSALRWLAELEGTAALPLLKQGLREAQPSVRGAAAMAVAELKGGEGGALLIPLLDDPVAPVRASAAASLGAFPGSSSVEALKKGLRDSHPTVRAAAIGALLEQGVVADGLTEAVHGLVNHTDPGFRGAAARALGKARGAGVSPAIETLQILLNDTLPRPRIVAARSLGQMEGGESTVPVRVKMLKRSLADQDDAVRATAGGAILHLLHDDAGGSGTPRQKAQMPARP